MKTLSLCCIAKNEETNLRALTESVTGLMDEMILVDTGSTDNTVSLAKELGWKVFHFEWIDDFGAARQYAFNQATKDYVMWLDLDDELRNREGFLKWKTTMMELADYFVAPYFYSHDANTKEVNCKFLRERVFARELGFKWKYPIHEGVPINSGLASPRMGQVRETDWHVWHRRTDADLKADAGRNIRILKANEHQLDGRLEFYYGKELFDVGNIDEAKTWLGKAVVRPNKELEMHDRVLAMQYYGLCLHKKQDAITLRQIAHQGLELAPHRAEFAVMLGDAFMMQQRLQDAIPWFFYAKACIESAPSNLPGLVFNHKPFYNELPRLALCRIYINLGKLQEAEMEALEAVGKYGSEEGKKLLEEIQKIKANSQIRENPTATEESSDIVISCVDSPYPWDSELYKTKMMGGSETAAIEMAKHLSELSGRKVLVYNKRDSVLVDGLVEYRPSSTLKEYMDKLKPWMHIAWRHNFKITNAPTFVWCHDLFTQGGENISQYNKMLCLTPFHSRYVQNLQNVPEEKIYVTRNGISPEKFNRSKPPKEPFRFVYGSSPDRGLDKAMLVLDEVRKSYPEVTLHIHYGIEHLDKYGHKALREKLEKMFEERKDWVTYHGATPQAALMDSYMRSAYCVQPSDWIETSMISASEYLACGVYPIMRKIGGVVDTLAWAEKHGMATLVDSNCLTQDHINLYAGIVKGCLEAECYTRVKFDAESISWRKVAEDWLENLPKFF